MYTISKQFHFCASHQLLQLPDNHPCKRMHGHNYILEFVLQSKTLNKYGFVCDYKELDFIKKYIDCNIDHYHLNDVMKDTIPTAENIAKWFFNFVIQRLPQLVAVRVSETPKTWAEYRINETSK